MANSRITASGKMDRTEVSARTGGPGTLAPHLSAELELGREVTVKEDRIQTDGHWESPCPTWGEGKGHSM